MELLAGYLKYVLKEKKKEKKKENVLHTSKKKHIYCYMLLQDILSLHIFMTSVSCSSGSCKKPVVS